MNKKIRGVILLSGGLDSAANLALAIEGGHSVAVCLTVNYGQRAYESEHRAARALCSYYGVPHQEVDLRWLGRLGGSALTDVRIDVPEVAEKLLDDVHTTEASARAVWVPNRNGVFIAVAASFAEVLKADAVWVGFNREEAATFPDNSEAFLRAQSEALRFSTNARVVLDSFTVQMDKREIVTRLRSLDTRGQGRRFPREMVWSCYYSGESMCGKCESCERFKRAWQEV